MLIQQQHNKLNFTENLKEQLTKFFITEETKETTLKIF